MVTVTQRPQGIKIIDQPVTAVITNNVGAALVTLTNHALETGDYIYIESDIDEYNGIWYVIKSDNDNFRLLDESGAGYQEFYQDATITYYQSETHQWSSAYLPIVYKASSDKWPLNYVNTTVVVSSQAEDNGYTLLNISAPTGAQALEYVKLNDGNVYQVIENGSGTTTINLAYDVSNSFTTAQKYYNNYQVKVKVYAGLEAGEYWEAKKPFREVATLSFTPDASNNVMFSVADYIKGLLAIKNNPTQYSMPLNLDAFTAFYIETAEAYDGSDGYAITTEESEYEEDDFVGYAIAGKLPFKNFYSGFFSEYVTTSGEPAEWLNTLTNLMGVVDQYFDLSFIKNLPGAFQIIIDKYANDYLYETETIEYADFGIGVYRIPLTFTSAYDQFCVRAFRPGTPEIPAPTPPTLDGLGSWTNGCGGAWALGAAPTTSVNGNGGVDGYITGAIAAVAGVGHEFTSQIDIGVTGMSSPVSNIKIALLSAGCVVLDSVEFNYTTAGVKTETFVLTPPTAGTYIGVYITNNTPFDTKNYTINSFVFDGLEGDASEGTPAVPGQYLTEEICIDIYEVCGFDDGAVIQPTAARRLLEEGGFRLLEE
jgi:hypothetical protein